VQPRCLPAPSLTFADHARYTALDCRDKHDTTFFDDCCHPLLASESLSDLPSYCTPNATASSSASAFTETAASTDSANLDAATEYSSATASVVSEYSSATAAQATASTTIANSVADWAHTHTSTSTYVAPTTSSTSAAATSTSSGGSGGSGQVHTDGKATFFYQQGQAGECGQVRSDSEMLIAIDKSWWPDYETNSESSLCGKWIEVTNTENGKSVEAEVVDVCPTCVSDNSLDLSTGAFDQIASENTGTVSITWKWA